MELLVTFAFLFCWKTVAAVEVRSVDSYGAIANVSSVEAAVKNSQTISRALQNATQGSAVLVPKYSNCLLYTSPSPRDATLSRMPSSA